MAQSQHVLRLKRTDHKSEHLLLNITRRGPKDLDLNLIATDKEHLFHGSIKESSVKSFQATNFTGDLEQWKAMLSFALLRKSPDGPRPDFLQGVETVASISGDTVAITFRKNVDGITQRLGTIKLQQNDEEEIQIFDWVESAVATSDDLRAEMEKLQDSATSQQDQIARLTRGLDNLFKAKKEHEDELLSKFAALLNTKKLKIRDQQRLLNGAQIDPEAVEEVAQARAPSANASRRAGASRAGKRKANGSKGPVEVEKDGNNDDAETVATENPEDDSERTRQETPETEDGDTTENEADADPSIASKSSKATGKSQTSRGQATQKQTNNEETMEVDEGRSSSLPRRRKRREPTPPAAVSNTADDDDETTDDEL